MNVNSNAIQQYVRIALYCIFTSLGTYGVTVSASSQTVIISIACGLATLAWTAYGTRLNGLLEQAKAQAGVQGIDVRVDPVVIKPAAINDNTSSGITAKAA